MDTKDKEPERSQYQKLKAKYAKPINATLSAMVAVWKRLCPMPIGL